MWTYAFFETSTAERAARGRTSGRQIAAGVVTFAAVSAVLLYALDIATSALIV